MEMAPVLEKNLELMKMASKPQGVRPTKGQGSLGSNPQDHGKKRWHKA